MSSVDDRIVAMKFENSQFESGIKQSESSLNNFKKSLDFKASSKSMNDLQNTASRFSMGGLTNAAQGVSAGFVAMSTVAITALANITNKAIDAGLQLAKSFTIAPVKAGLQEYEATLETTQTLMSGTGETVEEVTRTLKDLNTYSDRTIYSFSDMTKNITAFTNAGLSSKKSASIMMGISNAAASAGINAQQAAGAMRGFGQSMSMGFVGLQDWNQVDNAQLATKEFKEELIKSGIAVGTLKKGLDGTVRTTKGTEVNFKNLRSTLHEQWLTSEALTGTLAKYSDESTEVGKKAAANATRVKTLSQMMGILKESAQSGWSESFLNIFGNLEEATDLFTGVNDTLGGFIKRSADARNKVLKDWNELGGRSAVIKGISNTFYALMDVLSPISKAFRDIFPATTGKQLAQMSKDFRDFTKTLFLGEDTMTNLRRTFAGIFALFSIGWEVVKGIAGVFADLIGVVTSGSGGFLEFTGGIGDFLVGLEKAIKKGDGLTNFFEGLSALLTAPVKAIQVLASAFVSLFDGFDSKAADTAGKAMGRLGERGEALQGVGESLMGIWDELVGTFGRVGEVVQPLADILSQAIQGLGGAIADSFGGDTFDSSLDAINTALFGGIVLLVRKFVNNGLKFDIGGGGMFSSVSKAMDQLTGTLEAMQANIQANTLLKIAGAVALLTISIVALSMIDPEKLRNAMIGLAVGFGQLLLAMKIMEAISTSAGFLRMPFVAGAMILLSTAILILTKAVQEMAEMELGDMARGLLGIAAVMKMLTTAIGPLAAKSSGMITAGAGLILLAIALNLMAKAVQKFGEMDLVTMGKGLLGVAGSLAVIAAGMHLMPPNMVASAAAILILSGAMKVLASALQDFASMNMKEIGTGLLTMAGALVVIAGAMHIMPKGMVAQAAALVLVAGALKVIGGVLQVMGGMSVEEIAKSLITLAGALAILAGGLYLMTGSLAGSAALVVAAAALAVLVPVLIALGAMSWESIIKGMAAMAGVFIIFGLAGLVLAPVAPIMIALGAAILMFGAGLALAGAGALALAAAIGILAAAGTAGAAVVVAYVTSLIALIPSAIEAIGRGIVAFLKVIGSAGPEFAKAFTAIMTGLLNAVITIMPKLRKALNVLIDNALNVFTTNIPKLVAAGMALILAILQGVDNNIERIVKTASSIIQKFLITMGDEMPKIVDAGFKLIIKFINGLSKAIDENSAELGEAGGNLATSIVEGVVKGIMGGIGAVKDAAEELAKNALNAAKDFLGIKSPSKEFEKLGVFVDEGFAKGVIGGMDVVKEGMDALKAVIDQTQAEIETDLEAHQARLKELKKEDKKDEEAIAKAKKKVAAAKEEQEAVEKAHQQFKKHIEAEKAMLAEKGKAYDQLVLDIEAAEDKLAELTAARDQQVASVTSQYSTLPTIEGEMTPEDYIALMAAEQAKIDEFKADLATLRSMGMDDATYNKLLEEGFGAQPFVDALIEAGPGAVEAVDAATAALTASAAALGAQAGADMHQAGIDAQAGLLAGLNSDKVDLEGEMGKIARKIVRAIRKALKIKSPSRVMEEIGKYTNQGLAKGLDKHSKDVEKSAAAVADGALSVLRTTMSRVSDAVANQVDMTPVIAPVLDLTQMANEASKIGTMFPDTSVMGAVSYGQANDIETARKAAQDAKFKALEEGSKLDRSINFKQEIHTPKAPSPIEVYRDTKSLLSIAKEALDA